MTDNDILTMLTSEDSARVAAALIESTKESTEAKRRESTIRDLDHQLWKRREEERLESRLRLDHAYRWHVFGASVLNMISTAAIVLLILKVVNAL